ncbi:uncharacterized protein B0T15DRAFT_577025 [Chaetomium strumarium]|uniref:Integral membrane protein n=1 Tax=Chaetomium strumarium TaxID=1170767 RepID=A0AAJ0GPH1_9PEZI|nr:integral membrane protein [Chaetomium strumarium]
MSSLDHLDSRTPLHRATPDPKNSDTMLRIINIVTASLCSIVVCFCAGLKLYARYRLRPFCLDDFSKYGGGIHKWDVPTEDIMPFLQCVYAMMVVYGPCAVSIKASILLFVTRIFKPLERMVLVINIFLVMMFCYYFILLFIKAFICRPIEHFWNPNVDGTCFNLRSLILADAAISVVSDIAILLIPFLMTGFLQLPLKRRLRVGAILGAGGIACICSVIRLADIVKNGQSHDITYVFAKINLWGLAEVTIGVICASLPVLPALLRRKGTNSSGRTPYAFGSSSDRIEMQRSRRGMPTTKSRKPLPGNASDENVLITDRNYCAGNVETSIHGNDSGVFPCSSVEDQGIMKIVEIKQTMSHDLTAPEASHSQSGTLDGRIAEIP